MKVCELQALVSKVIKIRRSNLATETPQIRVAQVIGDNQENVRSEARLLSPRLRVTSGKRHQCQ